MFFLLHKFYYIINHPPPLLFFTSLFFLISKSFNLSVARQNMNYSVYNVAFGHSFLQSERPNSETSLQAAYSLG